MTHPHAYPHLLSPLTVGAVTLKNRVWMAPLTRMRAGEGGVPHALNATYYAQRATAGLIVTEATQISQQGQGYINTPGIYTDAQEAGWKNVVQAVHDADGHIALQLWHVGRISHSSLQEDQQAPVAPSAVPTQRAKVVAYNAEGQVGQVRCDDPRALALSEIAGIIGDYRQAAQRAQRAGFDLVEVHAANGYLLNQFLSTNTNLRTDVYGGSIENRARIVLEVIDAVSEVMGADRVGIRLSPNGIFNDIQDTEAEATALYLAEALTQRGIAYVHIAEPDWVGGPPLTDVFRQQLRQAFPAALIYCSGYTAERAEATITAGLADAIAFGRSYIANPDLVQRFATQANLNVAHEATFYGGDGTGYTDYPTLSESADL
jgi:N-ethylmaleimide reductase